MPSKKYPTGIIHETLKTSRSYSILEREKKPLSLSISPRVPLSAWAEPAYSPFVYFAPFPVRADIMVHFSAEDHQNQSPLLIFFSPLLAALIMSSQPRLRRFDYMADWPPRRE